MYAGHFTRRIVCRSTLRHFSTPTPSNTTSKNTNRPIPPQSPNPNPQNHNIKLKPAPIKPASLSPSNPQSPPKPHKQQRPIRFSPNKDAKSPVPPALVEETPPSSWHIVETFKHLKKQTIEDLEAAHQDGTFAPRPLNANWMHSTFHSVWELGKFYFRGVRLIVTRQRDSFRIRRRIRRLGPPLTRAEHRMILTQRHDFRKIIPFTIIAIIIEESIPFIALLAPSTLPTTCLLPRQLQRIAQQKDRVALQAFQANKPLLHQILDAAEGSSLIAQIRLHRSASQVFCSVFRLPTFGGEFLRRPRITRHLKFLAEDDQLIRQENNGSHLSSQELEQALRERGFLLSHIPSTDRLRQLRLYLREVDQSPGQISRLATLLLRS